MPFTPLVPLPGSAGEETLDPFEELLRPSPAPASSSSKPIFPPQPSSTRRPTAQPINIPSSSASTAITGISSDDSIIDGVGASQPLATPSSASSDFGAFVSVDPSQDPLSAAFSPTSEFVSPPLNTLGGANDAFVEEAKRRAENDEKRIMDEFMLFEQNPSSLMTDPVLEKPIVTDPDAATLPNANVHFQEFDQEFEDLTVSDPPRSSSLPLHSTQADKNTSSVPADASTSAFDSPYFDTSTPTEATTPDIHRSQTSTPTIDTIYPAHDSTPSSMSSSFTSYISSSLPRKWSTLLRSPSSSALATQPSHPHPTHAASMPAAVHVTSTDIKGPLTHDSPFAAHPFIPPSGAPGFNGDRNWNKGFEFSSDQKVGRPIDLVGRSETARKVLSSQTAETLRPSLPPLFRLAKKWTLLYSLDQHGISLATFYSRVSPHCGLGGCLLAIRDAEDQTFGVWMGDGIQRSATAGPGKGYYGSGESFLWKQESDEAVVQVFKWTGKNDYVALCESDYISFGGGDGKYGLFLDASLYDGSTAPCPTFDNEPLCGPKTTGTVRFECVGLEAWGILR